MCETSNPTIPSSFLASQVILRFWSDALFTCPQQSFPLTSDPLLPLSLFVCLILGPMVCSALCFAARSLGNECSAPDLLRRPAWLLHHAGAALDNDAHPPLRSSSNPAAAAQSSHMANMPGTIPPDVNSPQSPLPLALQVRYRAAPVISYCIVWPSLKPSSGAVVVCTIWCCCLRMRSFHAPAP